MKEFESRGNRIRADAKALVYEYMQVSDLCQPGREGVRLSPIFRACGFDWGEYEKATSSNQQYWVVALMRELQEEGKVERVSASEPWRLKCGTLCRLTGSSIGPTTAADAVAILQC